MVDRGPQEREILDLVKRLEGEAAAAGGRVHTLLGNHEAMNLVWFLRDVPPSGFASFAAEESARDRQAGWVAFRAAERDPEVARSPALKDSFEFLHPRGYFGRARAFGRGGEYGDSHTNLFYP